jgi:hypothetical protein
VLRILEKGIANDRSLDRRWMNLMDNLRQNYLILETLFVLAT